MLRRSVHTPGVGTEGAGFLTDWEWTWERSKCERMANSGYSRRCGARRLGFLSPRPPQGGRGASISAPLLRRDAPFPTSETRPFGASRFVPPVCLVVHVQPWGVESDADVDEGVKGSTEKGDVAE